MIPQVTAAALVAENRLLASPASVHGLPTSANQKDQVLMATYAAHRLLEVMENVSTFVGIELLASAQGLDFRQPFQTSPCLRAVHAAIRADVTTLA